MKIKFQSLSKKLLLTAFIATLITAFGTMSYLAGMCSILNAIISIVAGTVTILVILFGTGLLWLYLKHKELTGDQQLGWHRILLGISIFVSGFVINISFEHFTGTHVDDAPSIPVQMIVVLIYGVAVGFFSSFAIKEVLSKKVKFI